MPPGSSFLLFEVVLQPNETFELQPGAPVHGVTIRPDGLATGDLVMASVFVNESGELNIGATSTMFVDADSIASVGAGDVTDPQVVLVFVHSAQGGTIRAGAWMDLGGRLASTSMPGTPLAHGAAEIAFYSVARGSAAATEGRVAQQNVTVEEGPLPIAGAAWAGEFVLKATAGSVEAAIATARVMATPGAAARVEVAWAADSEHTHDAPVARDAPGVWAVSGAASSASLRVRVTGELTAPDVRLVLAALPAGSLPPEISFRTFWGPRGLPLPPTLS